MGRSVSIPSGAAVTVRVYGPPSAYYCRTCAHCREEETHAEEGESCTRCEAKNHIPDVQFDDDATRMNWDDDIMNLSDKLRDAFPSLTKCDRWLGRGNSEDHAILENRHAAVSVSEYCGVVAVCLVPEPRSEYESSPMIAHHWCAQVEAKFRKIVAEAFPT